MRVNQLIEIYRTTGPKHRSRNRTGPASFQVIKRRVLEDGTKIFVAQSPAIPLPGNESDYSFTRQDKRPR